MYILSRFEEGRFCKSPLLILMANVSPMSVVLPSRMVAYVAAVPALAAFLPVTDIALLQVHVMGGGYMVVESLVQIKHILIHFFA